MSAHWFSTLAFSIPGISLIFPFFSSSAMYQYLNTFFLLPGFYVFSGKVSFISDCQIPQIQFLAMCSFYCKAVFFNTGALFTPYLTGW